MISETQQQKFGQIWLIRSRAMIFQSLDSFLIHMYLYAAISGDTLLQSVMSQQNKVLSNGILHTNFTRLYFS